MAFEFRGPSLCPRGVDESLCRLDGDFGGSEMGRQDNLKLVQPARKVRPRTGNQDSADRFHYAPAVGFGLWSVDDPSLRWLEQLCTDIFFVPVLEMRLGND